MVRKGDPKHIHDLPDLLGPGVDVGTPDSSRPGNGKLSALAASFMKSLQEGAKSFGEPQWQSP
jgi:ABC-type sulfate transport system substrate-binding protein